MTEAFVDLYLPKFKMEERYDLRDNLIGMGMRSAFSSNADFSGMSEKDKLMISKVFHKSFVAVDEKGTEAAAATAVIVELTSAHVSRVLEFKVDHPFFFFIRHNKSKSILFFGRFCSPLEWIIIYSQIATKVHSSMEKVNCSAKISALSNVATYIENACSFLSTQSHSKQAASSIQKPSWTTKEHPSTSSFYHPNETILNRKESAKFFSLLSNLLFWLCCLKIRWNDKSSLHKCYHLALCQMLTSREMQFILLTLTERKKNPEKKKNPTNS